MQELAELSSVGRDLSLSRFRLLEPDLENDDRCVSSRQMRELIQIERVLDVNELHCVSTGVVEAARQLGDRVQRFS
jgi:hypothetical protein